MWALREMFWTCGHCVRCSEHVGIAWDVLNMWAFWLLIHTYVSDDFIGPSWTCRSTKPAGLIEGPQLFRWWGLVWVYTAIQFWVPYRECSLDIWNVWQAFHTDCTCHWLLRTVATAGRTTCKVQFPKYEPWAAGSGGNPGKKTIQIMW
jgi:hypothetical protein